MRQKSGPHLKNAKGQIIVEYVLLLVIAVSVAVLIISQLVSREPGAEGILVSKWKAIQEVIGKDMPDQ